MYSDGGPGKLAVSRKVQLSMAVGDYDINQALIHGDIVPAGTEATVLTYPSPQRHARMNQNLEFDVCEYSAGSYLMVRERRSLPFVAIPAFPHRRFRHSHVFTNSKTRIEHPKELEGRRVGLRTWETTNEVWVKGILHDYYDVDLTKITWFSQDEEDVLPLELPAGIILNRVPAGASVTAMLETGELDALIYPEVPSAILNNDPRVRRLFMDTKATELEYYERSKIFPIMHVVVIKESVLERHPWVAFNVLEAFRASKDRAFRRMQDPRTVSLTWLGHLLEEQRRVLGPDPWAYDLSRSRTALETLIRYAVEQGMLKRAMAAEELFYPGSLMELPHYV
jgi:4,5-dihydroxyphthalate decarboxylase